MGSESADVIPGDGEGPVRIVTLGAFYISKYAVSNAQFAEFVRATGYRTEAQRHGWSFVFRNHVREELRGPSMPGMFVDDKSQCEPFQHTFTGGRYGPGTARAMKAASRLLFLIAPKMAPRSRRVRKLDLAELSGFRRER